MSERKKNGKNAWEANKYMISTDHGLVKWADRMFLGEVPYVIPPSIWYSLLLGLTDHTENDYRAYVEFMKLRYTRTISYTPEEIIYNTTQLTEKGEIQDRVIDILTDENLLITKDNEQLEIQEKVGIAYDKAVDGIRKSEYNDGYSLENVKGYRSGKEDTEKFSHEKGKRAATLEIKKNALLQQIADKAKKKKRIDYIIIGIGTISILVVVFLVYKWVWHDLSPDKIDQFDLIIIILSYVLGGMIWMMIRYFLYVDLKALENRERNKVIDELGDIEGNLKELK